MIDEGGIVLFRFPRTDQESGKLRPALVLRRLPGPYDDFLICMVSTQLSRQVPGLDDLIEPGHSDYARSGLKAASVFRLSRLAVVEKSVLFGTIGNISFERLFRIRAALARWIQG